MQKLKLVSKSGNQCVILQILPSCLPQGGIIFRTYFFISKSINEFISNNKTIKASFSDADTDVL